MDAESAGWGALATTILGALGLAVNRVIGDPDKRMAHQVAVDAQEHSQAMDKREREHSQAMELVAQLAKRVEALEGLVGSQAQQLASQAQQIGSLTTQVAQEQSQAAGARADAQAAREEVAALRLQLAQLEGQAQFTHSADQQTIARLRADLESAREEIATLRERVQELETELQARPSPKPARKTATKKKGKSK